MAGVLTSRTCPTFDDLLDRAVLSHSQRLELLLLRHVDPLAAHAKLSGIIIGQRIAERIAAEKE
jgi:hypothetical protein